MSIIVPAILESDPDYFEDRISQLMKISGAKRFQIDFSDGIFTKYSTVPLSETPVLNPEFEWEAHLMVADPQSVFLDAQISGFNTVIFHYEAAGSVEKVKNLANSLKGMGISVGLGINPETQIEEILPCIDFVDQVLLLGIHPGKQGQEILPGTFDRLRTLRNVSANIKIEIDGGINKSNISEASKSGADYIVVGSAIFKSSGEDEHKSPSQNFEELSSKLY